MPLPPSARAACAGLAVPATGRPEKAARGAGRRAARPTPVHPAPRRALHLLAAAPAAAAAATLPTWGPATPGVVLVADVGGTNCRFVLSSGDAELVHVVRGRGGGVGGGGRGGGGGAAVLVPGSEGARATRARAPPPPPCSPRQAYPTKDHATFASALAALAAEPGFAPPAAAALAVAGPVSRNAARLTNVAWTVDGDALTAALGVPVAVLNDFEAAGYGVLDLETHPSSSDVQVLNPAPATPRAPIAVLGPGTGLGQAQLMWCEGVGGYRVWPSEGAHAGFAPRGAAQRSLHASLEAELGYVTVEHVACGAGLARIDAHLARVAGAPRALAPAAVTAAALASPPTDAIATDALATFLAIVGAEAGAMALRGLARGGVFVCGGITPKVSAALRGGPGSNPLLDAFLWKDHHFSELLASIPLYAVLDDGLGLRGARLYARRLMEG